MASVTQPYLGEPTTSPALAATRSTFGRPRFAAFVFSRTPSGQSSAEVTLELDGKRGVGRAIGASSPHGDLRISAEACLRALDDLAMAGRFELVGVKHVRAFDANLAIVSVAHLGEDPRSGAQARLVGCYLADHDVRRGIAIAVLNATNRVLGKLADGD
jgi:hypothetical protein